MGFNFQHQAGAVFNIHVLTRTPLYRNLNPKVEKLMLTLSLGQGETKNVPSEKLTEFSWQRVPFQRKQISQMTEEAGWNWVYTNKTPAKKKQLEVCFTGFPDSEKDSFANWQLNVGLLWSLR